MIKLCVFTKMKNYSIIPREILKLTISPDETDKIFAYFKEYDPEEFDIVVDYGKGQEISFLDLVPALSTRATLLDEDHFLSTVKEDNLSKFWGEA